MDVQGGCLCGAVRYTAVLKDDKLGACHCDSCKRWTGGVQLGVEVPLDGMTFTGQDHIKTFQSSEWAERAFCDTCGSSLYYRITAEGPHNGIYHICAGGLDDMSGLVLREQIFIDRKPDGYRFAQETHDMTSDEVFALFAQS